MSPAKRTPENIPDFDEDPGSTSHGRTGILAFYLFWNSRAFCYGMPAHSQQKHRHPKFRGGMPAPAARHCRALPWLLPPRSLSPRNLQQEQSPERNPWRA
jgi:hypothetical protein